MNDFPSFDPFVDLGGYREAMRQFLEGGVPMPRDFMPFALASVVVPVDILDSGPEIIVQANLPGVQPEDVTVTVTGTTLTIKGAIKSSEEFKGATYLRKERKATAYQRSVTLPVSVEVDRADARFADGVLTLTLPKSESVRPKTIKITRE
ncbi:MAG TPA: Hsp20/alpha crystallin family protein [Anaerolineaceae bacterium]